MHTLLVQFSPGNVEANDGRGGKPTSHLMASCARNVWTKNY